MADINRIKSNIESMIAQGAPEQDIDDYVASEGVTLDQLQGSPQPQAQQAPQLGQDDFNKQLEDRVYRGDSLDNIKTWMANNGRNPNEYQGLEAAVKYKQRGLPGRSSVTQATTPEVKKPEYDAGHGAFGAGVNGALHAIPYVDEIGGALDSVIYTGNGMSAWETGKSFGDQMDANIDQNRAMAEYDWNHHPYAYGTGMTVGVVGTGLAGGAAVRGLAALPGAAGRVGGLLATEGALGNMGRAAAQGAIYGSDVDNGDLGDRLQGAGIGATLGVAGDRAFRGVARVAQPVVKPAVQALKDAGVRLSPGQLTGPVGQFIENRVANIPFVGNAVRGIQRDAYQDFDRAMINRGIAPSGEMLIDGSTRTAPGVNGSYLPRNVQQYPVTEDGRSLYGTVMRDGQDWLQAARKAVESRRPTPRATPIAPDGSVNDGLFGALADSRVGLLKNAEEGSVSDELIGNFLDREILFQRPRNGPMTTEDTGRILQSIKNEMRIFADDTTLPASERQAALGKLGDLEDLFHGQHTELSKSIPDPTRSELLRGPIGSQRTSPGVSEATNNLGRMDDAVQMSADGRLFTPQEFLDSTRGFKVPQGQGSAYELAQNGNQVLRGPVPSDKPMTLQDMITGGIPIGGLAYFSPKGVASAAIASGIYTQPGRRAVESLLTGNRGVIGDRLSQVLRGAANQTPRAGGLYGNDLLGD